METALPKMMDLAYETVENMVDYGADRAVEIVKKTFPQFTKELLTSETARQNYMAAMYPDALAHVQKVMYADDAYEFPGSERAALVGDEFSELIFFLTELNGEFAVWNGIEEINGQHYRLGFNYGD